MYFKVLVVLLFFNLVQIKINADMFDAPHGTIQTPTQPPQYYNDSTRISPTHFPNSQISGSQTNMQSDHRAPGPIRHLNVYSKNKNSISLRWEPPNPPNDHLFRYKITYCYYWWVFTALPISKTIEINITECKIWSGYHCTTLYNLWSHKNYTIFISAFNIENRKHGATSSITTTTQIDQSYPPNNLTIKWLETDEVELYWEHPNHSNGEIRFFTITINPTFPLNDTNYIDVRKELNVSRQTYNRSYHYRIPSEVLSPSTDYIIKVSANNGLVGKAASKPYLTAPFRPSLEMKILVLTNNTFITLVLNLISQKDRNATYTLIIYTKTQVNKSGNVMFMQRQCSDKDLTIFDKVFKCNLRNYNETLITIGYKTWPVFCDVGKKNSVLVPETSYEIVVVLENTVRNQTSNRCYYGVYSTTGQDIDGSNLYLLAILVLVPVLLLILGIVLFTKQKPTVLCKNQFYRQTSLSRQVLQEEHNEIPLAELLPTEVPFIKPNTFTKNVQITSFVDYVKESIYSDELERQHALFPRGQTKSWDCGITEENKPKNRFNNLLAYDHSRVGLKKIPSDPFSDYINANYIDGFKMKKAYIATQGPKPNTLNDFWRMIWQENVKYIAMVANIIENGKKSVEKYWPEKNELLTFGEIIIQHVSSDTWDDFECRNFLVQHNGQSRPLTQIHFRSWPDHGIPLYPQTLVPFLQKLLPLHISSKSPLVVHCNAGVGRTGIVILCDISLRMAARQNSIDMLKTLKHIRDQRPNMVDNIQQYKLAHLAIVKCLVGMKTGLPCNDITNSVRKILKDGTVRRQMNYLAESQWQDQAMKTVGQTEEPSILIPEKNRFQDFIPETQGRVLLPRYPLDDEASSYINAVAVDGFRSPGRFIVTQQPLPHTVNDFWRLIDQYDITIVLSLNEINIQDRTSCTFWPTEDNPEMTPVDYISLLYTESSSFEYYSIYKIQLSSKDALKQITIFSVSSWLPNMNCPRNVEHFLCFWRETEAVSSQSDIVAVTCYDGVKASGLYTALSFIIKKMKIDQVCDVCEAVRVIRYNQSRFVEEEEQFAFLYKAAAAYMRGFNSE